MKPLWKGKKCKCGKPAYCRRMCKACYNARWRKENPEAAKQAAHIWRKKNPQYAVNWSRAKRANCSPSCFQKHLRKQKGKCALCGKRMKETPRADHNHKTGKFRGLLHERCNLALGAFKDSIALLQKAIAYLRRTQ